MGAIVINLPDNSKLQFEQPPTSAEVARRIGKRLGEEAIAAKVNQQLVDLSIPITSDASIEILTLRSPEALEILRHSTAHLLAQAVKELWPKAQITIGPVIENGFYYDIDFPETMTTDDLPRIEEKMREVSSRNLEINRKVLSKADAIQLFKGMGELFKTEIISEITDDTVGTYEQGSFIDLCRGPHVPNTRVLKHFKLLSVAGAYWRGNEKNPMLTRIYGTAWSSQKDLEQYLHQIEEAKKRDHRKLGPELGLFTFLPVAPAMPFYLPKGVVLYRLLTDFMRRETAKVGYQEVMCPQLMLSTLWQQSGHLENFSEGMFAIEEEGEVTQCLKPMNCPGHVSLYASALHSYRELPVRFSEFTRLHRNERVGVTHGLFRTRAFAQDDGHIFCMPDQISAESRSLIDFTLRIYRLFGFKDIKVRLATRPEKFMGAIENWDKATKALADSLQEAGLEFTYAEGEGAFYGPKIEFHIKDCLGRSWQCGTVQIDFSMPERFNLQYMDTQSQPQRPVMIHRAILGSLERFMGILLEHHAGHLPFWISPTQVMILNVTDAQADYARSLQRELQDMGTRVEVDLRNEKLSYKIRQAQLQKVPLMLVLGNKELAEKTVSVRKHTGEMLNDYKVSDLKNLIASLIEPQEE